MKDTWECKWIEDIDFLRDNLIEKHCNLFCNIKKKEFLTYVNNLKEEINNLDFNDMKVELSRIVASIGDAHTAIAFPVKYFIPVEFYYFKDGVYITEDLYGNNIKNHKVLKISDMRIEEVLETLKEIISYENESFFKHNVVQYLKATEVLYGALLIDNINEVTMTLEDLEGNIKTKTIKALDREELKQAIKERKEISSVEVPLCRRNKDKLYWREYIKSNKTLYLKYNSCREMEGLSVAEFIRDTIEFIENNYIERLIIDFRDNLGGDSTLFDPFIEYVKHKSKLNKKHNLFIIIGRKTFSSALLNVYELKNNTKALIIGEATGGKPNCYGEIKRFNLPSSGFSVSYSTKFYKLIDDDQVKTLLPDIMIEETIEDFINNRDPVMEYIKKII